MAANNLMPSNFVEYEKVIKLKKIEDLNIQKRLHRFPYRYRFARAFKGVIAPEVGRSLGGYEAGLKMTLAFSAYESIDKAARLLKVVGVRDERMSASVANNIRKNENLRHLLITYSDSDKLKIRLEKIFDDKSDDVIAIARAVRNLFAHGGYTAGGAGISNKKSKQAMDSVADELLNYCDELFTACVEKLKKLK